jgi:ammonia channel protein AmtB
MLTEEKSNIDQLLFKGEEYLKTREELAKLIVAEKTSRAASSLFSTLVIFAVFLFALAFASVAAAYIISEYFEKASTGFIIVTLFYLVVGIILYFKKEKWLKVTMMNSMIKIILHNENGK